MVTTIPHHLLHQGEVSNCDHYNSSSTSSKGAKQDNHYTKALPTLHPGELSKGNHYTKALPTLHPGELSKGNHYTKALPTLHPGELSKGNHYTLSSTSSRKGKQ